jgi:predicted enzyme related to lactoylglutathione lyase
MILQVKFVSIPVEDQDRALSFYTEKLGFRVLTDQPFDANQRWIELQIPGGQTGLALFKMSDGIRPGSRMNLAFASDDVAATHAQLSARGVEFTQPPTAAAWGSFAMFKDSEGNSFVLSSRR